MSWKIYSTQWAEERKVSQDCDAKERKTTREKFWWCCRKCKQFLSAYCSFPHVLTREWREPGDRNMTDGSATTPAAACFLIHGKFGCFSSLSSCDKTLRQEMARERKFCKEKSLSLRLRALPEGGYCVIDVNLWSEFRSLTKYFLKFSVIFRPFALTY